VKLSLPETPKRAVRAAIDGFFKEKPLLEWNTFAPTIYHNNGWWVRCCAQVWNEVSAFLMDIGMGTGRDAPSDERLRIPGEGI